ncbi:hypothetical protein [Roseibium album]
MNTKPIFYGCRPTVRMSDIKLFAVLASAAVSFLALGFIISLGLWIATSS